MSQIETTEQNKSHVAEIESPSVSFVYNKDGNASGITADTKATVSLRSYGNKGYAVEIPFTVSDKKVETVKIDIKAGEKGTLITDKLMYLQGEPVVLSGKGAEGRKPGTEIKSR